MKTLIFALALVAGLLNPGAAQTTLIDPLRRLEEKGSRYMWQVGIAYSPQGEQGMGLDAAGIPCAYVRPYEERQLVFSGRWNLGKSWKVGADLVQVNRSLKERLLYPTEEAESIYTSMEIRPSSLVEQRIVPTSRLDPRIRVTFELPGSTSVSAAASRITDPMVLAATVGYGYSCTRPRDWVFADLGVGLVANSHVSLVASGSLSVPLDTAGLPLASVGLAVRYTGDTNPEQEVPSG